jgi:hypothetical protein
MSLIPEKSFPSSARVLAPQLSKREVIHSMPGKQQVEFFRMLKEVTFKFIRPVEK